ncbi:MAG: tetratricopeptide repeat protein [Cytophagaceae bacterium]
MNLNLRHILFLGVFVIFSCTRSLEVQTTEKKESKKQMAESHYVEGMRQYILQNYSDARTAFEKAYAVHPENAAVNYMLSKIYVAKGNPGIALQYATKAVKNGGKNKYYYLQLAEIYESQQNFPEAIKVMKKMLSEAPNASEHYYDLAALYVYQGNYDEALKNYQKAENIFGKTAELTKQKQQLLLRMNKLAEAITEGENLITEYPEQHEFKIQHIELLYHNNKTEDAIKLGEKIISKQPDYGHAHYVLAGIHLSQSNIDKAYTHLDFVFPNPEVNLDSKLTMIENLKRGSATEQKIERLKKYSAQLIEAHPDDARSFAAAGDVSLVLNDKAKALEYYLQAKELNKSQYALWNQILMLDAEMNNADNLIIHSAEALEVFPNQAMLWLYNGSAYSMKKKYSEAIDALDEGLKLAVNNKDMQTQFQLYLGDAYNGNKEYEKSDAMYQEVLKTDPNNAHALNNFSYFLSLRKEKLSQAKDMSLKLLKKHPNNPNYMDTHAWVLYMMGEYEEAKKILEEAAGLSNNGTIWEHYGDALFKLNDINGAVEKWKKAKELGDTSDLIDKKIKDKKLYE